MPLAAIFRISLVLSVAFATAGSVLDWIFPTLLSPPLQEHLEAEFSKESSDADTIFLILALPLMVLLLGAYAGLFFWKNWARHLYLLLGLTAYLISPFTGDQVYSAPAFTLYDLSTALFGFTLGLLYFSPLASRFTREAEQDAAANP